ncbi:hypothetical protein [Sphingobium psychrophilum]|nr:hypothetical protein [Sphingobium psychrophilum]
MILDPGPLVWILFWVAISMAALFGMMTPYHDGWLRLQRLVLHGVRSPVAPFIDVRKFARVWQKPRNRCFQIRTLVPVMALPLGIRNWMGSLLDRSYSLQIVKAA